MLLFSFSSFLPKGIQSLTLRYNLLKQIKKDLYSKKKQKTFNIGHG